MLKVSSMMEVKYLQSPLSLIDIDTSLVPTVTPLASVKVTSTNSMGSTTLSSMVSISKHCLADPCSSVTTTSRATKSSPAGAEREILAVIYIAVSLQVNKLINMYYMYTSILCCGQSDSWRVSRVKEVGVCDIHTN